MKVNFCQLLQVFNIVINFNCLVFVAVIENYDAGDDNLAYDFDAFFQGLFGFKLMTLLRRLR